MRFLKTLNLWEKGIQEAILSGQIKLQVGQWLTCGTDNPYKCRFVSAKGGCLWVIHKKPNCGKQFQRIVALNKQRSI